jgi:hypothetical protein
MSVLSKLSDWIDEIPPLEQPMRFGNKVRLRTLDDKPRPVNTHRIYMSRLLEFGWKRWKECV